MMTGPEKSFLILAVLAGLMGIASQIYGWEMGDGLGKAMFGVFFGFFFIARVFGARRVS
ncbi:MAG: hypothetical protein AB1813_09265 [Verrucomicrobiota bacterium]|jgi:uncharacterized membrane protein